jgi:hypothetical protein
MTSKDEKIQHIKSHIQRFRLTSNAITNIEKGVGNISACLLALSSNAVAEAMIAWFENNDITATRNWFYVSALLEYKRYLRADQPMQPFPAALGLLKSLIANNEPLVNSHVDFYETAFDAKRINDLNTRDFLAYQFLLAVRGDWIKLKERSVGAILALADSELGQKYLIDYHYFLALADGDVERMSSSIEQLLSPEFMKIRSEDEGGFTQDLIVTSAVIYVKIAARHGYDIKANSPFVPKEWMENDSLVAYDPIYSFLK